MLTELRIRDLGVIAGLDLLLRPGMTAVTGETGAGKTLLVQGIELLLGGRAEALLVRAGAGQAEVGVALKPGQAPLALHQGAGVEVIDNGGETAAGQARPVVLTNEAVVSDVGAPSASSGTTVVSLTVPQSDAAAVAAAGAAGRVSLVVVGGS